MKDNASIIIATWGLTLGDLLPYIELAKGLKRAGHYPLIVGPAEYRLTVEREGITFGPMAPSIADLQRQLNIDAASIHKKNFHPITGPFFMLRRMLMPNLVSSYSDVLNLSVSADLIITSSIAYGAMIAANKRDVPYVSVALSPLAVLSEYDQPKLWFMQLFDKLSPRGGIWVSKKIHSALLGVFSFLFLPIYKLRRQVGLKQPKNIREAVLSTIGTICFWSPLFAEKQLDFPPNSLIAGFPFNNNSGGEKSLPKELANFLESGAKPLIFTLGATSGSISSKFFLESVKSAQMLGYRSILLSACADDTAKLKISDDIYICNFADHSALFPYAAAVVHHGGIGTLSKALKHGCLQLIVPLHTDQPDNARRAERLGVAKVIPIKNYNCNVVCNALSSLLSDTSISREAAVVSKKISSETGIDNAVEFIQKILNTGNTSIAGPVCRAKPELDFLPSH